MTLQAHLETGTTTVCRAWVVSRKDGATLGFTDHDRSLEFEGIRFLADAGMSARAFEQTTGLAVDNTEAIGVLSNDAIREKDLQAGLYDGAQVRVWLVNWDDVSDRKLMFRGSLGEIERNGKIFRSELRGLAEALNQPQGRVYQKPCSAVLGDKRCRFDTDALGYFLELNVVKVESETELILPSQPAFADDWFQRGRFEVLSGDALGQVGVIKRDLDTQKGRYIELWQRPSCQIEVGDLVRLEAGCDKRDATCRDKFDNFLNFRGFPDIPGEDWLVSYPVRTGQNDGGSLSG